METAIGVEPGVEVVGWFANYGLGGIVAGVLLYIFYRLAQRVMESQAERDKWDRDSREKMYSAINNLALKTETHTAATYAMAESIGRLPCSSNCEIHEVKKMSQGTRIIPKPLHLGTE